MHQKTSIVKIIVQNKTFDDSRSKSAALGKASASDSKFKQKRSQRKGHKN